MKNSKALLIKKTTLPDINSYLRLSKEFSDYGRWAILNDDTLWFNFITSSHPKNTLYGGYWALDNNRDVLYISARGNAFDLDKYLTKSLITFLIEKLRLRTKLFELL